MPEKDLVIYTISFILPHLSDCVPLEAHYRPRGPVIGGATRWRPEGSPLRMYGDKKDEED